MSCGEGWDIFRVSGLLR